MKVIEIFGAYLSEFFQCVCRMKDTYVANMTYATDKPYRMEIWSVNQELFDYICEMTETDFERLSANENAFWRHATGSNLDVPSEDYFRINRKKIISWFKAEDKEYYDSDYFQSLTDYLCHYIGASQPKNVTAVAVDLAKANHLTLSELFHQYQPVVLEKTEDIPKIYTTYFAKLKHLPQHIIPIAICGGVPEFYNGLCYKKLAPKWSFFSKWKETNDNDYYIQEFNKLVLNRLSADEVVKELLELSNNKDVALVCYEKPDSFCHRHLVANWLNQNGYQCCEFTGG